MKTYTITRTAGAPDFHRSCDFGTMILEQSYGTKEK